MAEIAGTYLYARIAATCLEALAVVTGGLAVTGQACNATATCLEAVASVSGGSQTVVGEPCNATATTLTATPADPALVEMAADGDPCNAVATCVEATISLSEIAVVGETCSAAATSDESTATGEDIVVVCDDCDAAATFVVGRAVVSNPNDPMRGPAQRWFRNLGPTRHMAKGPYRIWTGAAMGGYGIGQARPLQPGDEFIGFAVETANADDPVIKVAMQGTALLKVAGATIRSGGRTVYATSSNQFALAGSVAIGKIQASAFGGAYVWFEAEALRSLD